MAEPRKRNRFDRTLYYVPILHTAADLGTLAGSLRQEIGEEQFARRQALIEAMWERVELWADGLGPVLDRFRLYQDGLPVTEMAGQIVATLASQGSRNHRLLLRLVERGATLMGTESAPLLLKEYELAKQIVSGGADRIRLQEHAAELLGARDAFIAGQINATLQAGERGILLIGMLHNVNRGLAPDIELIVPFANSRKEKE